MNSFDEVRNFLADIHYINQGGCGIAALAMYEWLHKHNQLPNDFHFILGYRTRSEYEENSEVLNTGEGLGTACAHIFIHYNDEDIDCEKHVHINDFAYILETPDKWFIINCIDNGANWNPMFDKETNIPIIERELQIDLPIKKPMFSSFNDIAWI